MSSAITFYFKKIYPSFEEFKQFLNNYEIVDLTIIENFTFSQYLYKILYRRFHNSNIQYDMIEDFECDFANILEDSFLKYQTQLNLIKKMQNLTDAEILTLNTALANQSLNPNNAVDDPTQPLEYISAQAFTIAKDNKLQAYLKAISCIPTQLIDAMLLRCVNLFKTISPNQVFIYKEN